MCNLHSNKMPHETMRQLFDVDPAFSGLGNIPALPAIYPKYDAPIVTVSGGVRHLKRSHWGFLTPKKSKKTGNWLKPQVWNNTRDDKITTAPLWRDSFAARRCLVPATAYCEATGRNPATFHWFGLQGVEGFAFAGIWKHQTGIVGDTEVDSLVHSVVTTTPNALAAKYHNRMPVILSPASYETWLTGDAEVAFGLIRPYLGDDLHLIGEGVGLREEPS